MPLYLSSAIHVLLPIAGYAVRLAVSVFTLTTLNLQRRAAMLPDRKKTFGYYNGTENEN